MTETNHSIGSSANFSSLTFTSPSYFTDEIEIMRDSGLGVANISIIIFGVVFFAVFVGLTVFSIYKYVSMRRNRNRSFLYI
jgi:hypothetical protein